MHISDNKFFSFNPVVCYILQRKITHKTTLLRVVRIFFQILAHISRRVYPFTIIGEGMGKCDMNEIDRGTLPVDALSSGGGISCFKVSNPRLALLLMR